MPLVAHDKSWAICVPKKTGSQSMQAMLNPVAQASFPFHGGAWDGVGKRYMVVREPRERLTSMYWFSQTPDAGSPELQGASAPDWFERFLSLRANGGREDYTATQAELAKQFQPEQVFKLEDGLDPLMQRTLGYVPPMQRLNQTAERRTFDETFPEVSEPLQAWLADDAGVWY
jgi:hypothetical protein